MYGKVFQSDNPFWRIMGRLFDLVELNVLWLLCCLPVFTAGPSTVAFAYSLINLVRGEETVLLQDFFRSFRRNFRQGVGAGLLLGLTGVFLTMDVYLAYRQGPGAWRVLMVLFFVMLLLWSFVALYTFPLLAKFENSLRHTLLWTFTLSLRHLPKSLLMLFLLVVTLWICHLSPPLAFVVFGFLGELHAMLFAKIFKPWLPETGILPDHEEREV